jgi:hypothetical protein
MTSEVKRGLADSRAFGPSVNHIPPARGFFARSNFSQTGVKVKRTQVGIGKTGPRINLMDQVRTILRAARFWLVRACNFHNGAPVFRRQLLHLRPPALVHRFLRPVPTENAIRAVPCLSKQTT